MKSRVSAVFCDNYEKEQVYRAVKAGIDALGGIEAFVNPGENVLVKPNFLYPSEVKSTVTTHPAVISAVLRVLHDAEIGSVKVGDSPAAGSCRAALGKLALRDEDLFGAAIADMNEEVLTPNPDGIAAKEFHFAREAVEADAIIGVCKMKTHALERITGAVKNMFGLVCGMRKPPCHVKYPNATEFAKMLADIHRATPQRLHVMDAVVAMEGNGPASGNPTQMNLILASADPVALDTVFCCLVHLEPSLVPTNVVGAHAGLGTMDVNDIEILLNEGGETAVCELSTLVEKYGDPDFDVTRDGGTQKSLFGFLFRIASSKRKPVIDAEKCVKCGVCVEHCPVEGKAISFKNGKGSPPVYNYKKCIRCYCCQELCPQKAIRVK